MQHRYTGDIGDFGKYALLKVLADKNLTLGVVWYLNTIEESSSDGGFVQYLQSTEAEHALGKCDEGLHRALRTLVRDDSRRVSAVRERCILPKATSFYEESLAPSYSLTPVREERVDRRQQWCASALRTTEGADLVFLDPDNGLAPVRIKKHWKAALKYAFEDEIEPYLERDQSVILYNHQDRRKGGLEVQVEQGRTRLRELKNCGDVWAFTFHRRAVRIYFVVPSRRHQEILAVRSQAFIDGPFGARDHFHLFALPKM